MYLGKLTDVIVVKLTLDEMPVKRMPVVEMTVHEMTEEKIPFMK